MTDPLASGTPLVIAAHGTRDEAGVAECRALAERVARKLPGIPVELGFVELAEPGIPEAVRAAVAQAPDNPEGADGDEEAAACRRATDVQHRRSRPRGYSGGN
ncbi:hypothetical protein JCM18916A_17420 [Cutibacterium acnes subsp. acnes]